VSGVALFSLDVMRTKQTEKTIIIILKATYVYEDLQFLEKIMVNVGTRIAKSIYQVKRVLWVRRTPACTQ